MASGRDPHDEPSLFDLPLRPEGEEGEPDRSRARARPAAPAPGGTREPATRQRPLSLFGEEPNAGEQAAGEPATPERPGPREWGDPPEEVLSWDPAAAAPSPAPAVRPAGFAARLVAAAVDAAVLAGVAALAMIGPLLLGVEPAGRFVPGLGLFLLFFSFAYSVVPLAFWGATPGMAAAGLVARGADGGALTFGQTALRWLAGLLTLLFAGLPLLLALGGRSPADRLSGSATWSRPG
jgi:uncharacterized RDD family membrane protein YckC